LLAPVLQAMGKSDVMYELLFKETYPSWFYSINHGATTTWERWNSYSLTEGYSKESMNSLNHYAYGAIAKWFYEGILGINAIEPGFKRIRIEPQFGAILDKAKGDYLTPQGKVVVDWKINASALTMTVSIPKNTTAEIALPKAEINTIKLNGKKVMSATQLATLIPGQYMIEATINL
jgi:alpha-L-rhamnosidase